MLEEIPGAEPNRKRRLQEIFPSLSVTSCQFTNKDVNSLQQERRGGVVDSDIGCWPMRKPYESSTYLSCQLAKRD